MARKKEQGTSPIRPGGKLVAMYGRVSTDEQSSDMQFSEMREFVERRGWTLYKEYHDTMSGAASKKARPGRDLLMQDAGRKRFDVVLVYKYDRFARSILDLVGALEQFRALGIDFASLHENIDTTTPGGRLMFGIFASIAEFEREIIRERTRSGLKEARRKGKVLGHPSRFSSGERGDMAVRAKAGESLRSIAGVYETSIGTVQRAIMAVGDGGVSVRVEVVAGHTEDGPTMEAAQLAPVIDETD